MMKNEANTPTNRMGAKKTPPVRMSVLQASRQRIGEYLQN